MPASFGRPSTTPGVDLATQAELDAEAATREAWSGDVILTTDDGLSVLTPVYDDLASRGWSCTIAVNSSTVGSTDRMTWAQLAAYAAQGFEIASHSKTHTDATTLTAAQLATEYDDCIAASLANVGTTPTTHVHPYNTWNATAAMVALGRFERCYGYAPTPGLLPVFHRGRFQLRSDRVDLPYRQVLGRWTPQVFYCHGDAAGYTYEPTNAQLLAWFDYLESIGRRVVPASRDPLTASNLLGNPSFEDDKDGWSDNIIGTGTSAVETVTPADGVTGSKAIHLTSTGSDYSYVRQTLTLPQGSPTVQLSGLYKGSGSALRVRLAAFRGGSEYGSVAGPSTLAPSVGWATFTLTYAPSAADEYLYVDLQCVNTGDVYFDHVQLIPQYGGAIA